MPAKRRQNDKQQRGVALIMVVVALTVLTVVATEFAYQSRVDLQMATNSRDELRAYYLAQSGIGMSRLLLKFQKQVDSIPIPNIMGGIQAAIAGAAGGGAAAGAGAGAGAAKPSGMKIQLWRMAKIDCHLLQGLVSDEAASAQETKVSKGKFATSDEADAPVLDEAIAPRRAFGSFEGCFNSMISDDQGKIYLNMLNGLGTTERVVQVLLMQLFADKRFEFLFEKEDSNRVKVTPEEQIIYLRDWIDEDNSGSAMERTGFGAPFVPAGADESGPYDRYKPRYKPKNAWFDTLDELYLVHGVNDRFMAAFRDRFTVYANPDIGININSDDPLILYMAIMSVANQQRLDPRLRDPVFIDSLITAIRQARVISILGMTTDDFVKIVQAALGPEGMASAATIRRVIGDSTTTFTIKSVGEAGSVTKTLTAVVRTDGGLGRLLHWREE